MSSTGSFDPYTQNVTFLQNDGVTRYSVPIPDIDQWFFYAVKSSINYGAQLGACIVMLIVTACLTRKSHRYKPVHLLNILSLIFGCLRALLLGLFFTSPWSEFYSFFSLDTTLITRSVVANSVAGTVLPLFMSITVNMSLVLQAQTVGKVMERNYYYLICFFSGIVLLLAIGFRFAECVTNSLTITSAGTYYSQDWIATGALVTETVSIWFFSLIFSWKLFYTIQMRRKMGWSYPNPMEILLIMGGCTMVIPSVFAILEYVEVNTFPEAGTVALTMVALLLPLSSLWASMVTTSQDFTFNLSTIIGSRGSRDHLMENSVLSGDKALSTLSSSSGALDSFRDRQGSLAPITSTTIDSVVHSPRQAARDSTELDLAAMGVKVDKSYNVHCSPRKAGH